MSDNLRADQKIYDVAKILLVDYRRHVSPEALKELEISLANDLQQTYEDFVEYSIGEEVN